MTPKQRLALIVFNRYRCEFCLKSGIDIELPPEELEIHRIKAGYENGTYCHRNLIVLCKRHHEIINQAQRRSLKIQS